MNRDPGVIAKQHRKTEDVEEEMTMVDMVEDLRI